MADRYGGAGGQTVLQYAVIAVLVRPVGTLLMIVKPTLLPLVMGKQ